MSPYGRLSPKPARRACRSASISARRSSGRRGLSAANSRRFATILTYPQYWAWRLSACSPTRSLRSAAIPISGTRIAGPSPAWSPSMGWEKKFAPVRRAGRAARSRFCRSSRPRLGLEAGVPVHCGIHDSNASLYPHLLQRAGAFLRRLDRHLGHRDVGRRPRGKRSTPHATACVNVDALGDPVPSARFMGGREFSTLVVQAWRTARMPTSPMCSTGGIMLLPSVQAGSGPFRTANILLGRRCGRLDARPALRRRLALSRHDVGDLPGADRRRRPGHRRGAFREEPGLRRDAVGRDRARRCWLPPAAPPAPASAQRCSQRRT